MGALYDHFARKWFEQMAEITEGRVIGYIEEHGEPEDYHIFHVRKRGTLGLEVGIHVHRTEAKELIYKFHFHADKYGYEKWAREHMYLMEGFITFRMGPLIVAHPGRDQKPIKVAGKECKKPINIWEVEFGFLEKDRTSWFNLLHGRVIVSVYRNRNPEGPNSPAWCVNRVR